MAERVLALDGWRGLAIISVLVGHFFDPGPLNFSNLGVELFFVLSGRLMADLLFVKQMHLPKFYYRRLTRILPALTVFVVLFWVAGEILGTPYKMSPFWIASALTFTLNYAVLLTHPTGWLDHLWSVCVEEHSYMLLGLLAFVFGRSSGRPLAAIWALGIAAMIDGVVSSAVLHMPDEQVYWRSDVHLASIFVSGAVYLTLKRNFDPALIRRWATPVFVGALAVGLALETWASTPVIYTAGTLSFAVAVALCDVVARPIIALLSSRVLTQVGVWSFSLYLWQQPFYKTSAVFHHEWRAQMIVAAISVALASYYLVERPARRWLNGLWAKRESVQAV